MFTFFVILYLGGKILKEYLNDTGISIIVKKYEVRDFLIYKWLKKYNENRIEELKIKLMKDLAML